MGAAERRPRQKQIPSLRYGMAARDQNEAEATAMALAERARERRGGRGEGVRLRRAVFCRGVDFP